MHSHLAKSQRPHQAMFDACNAAVRTYSAPDAYKVKPAEPPEPEPVEISNQSFLRMAKLMPDKIHLFKPRTLNLKDADPALGMSYVLDEQGTPLAPGMAKASRKMTDYFKSLGLGTDLDDRLGDADTGVGMAQRLARARNERDALEKAERAKARISEEESQRGNPWASRAAGLDEAIAKGRSTGARARASAMMTQYFSAKLDPICADDGTPGKVQAFNAPNGDVRVRVQATPPRVPHARGLYQD